MTLILMVNIFVSYLHANVDKMNLSSKQTDICVIDGICYEKGFVNPAQKNLACRPDYSTDSWTALRGMDL